MPRYFFQAFFLSQALTLSHARSFRGDNNKRQLVIGGDEAEKDRHPYMISLQTEKSHFCGASLIALDVVLTAAHCVSAEYDFAVLGRHHWMDKDSGEELAISEHLPHPDFNYGGEGFDNDVMLLFLEKPASNDVPIVKLNSDSSLPKVNDTVTTMGWGDTDIDWLVFEMSDVLKSAEVRVQSNEECEQSQGLIRGDVHFYEGHVTDNMLCAEAEGIDSCQTDSGGPLVIFGESPADDVQVGIVSWGYSCAHEHFPGVYSRVSSYYEWIQKQVCKKSSNPPDSFQCSDEKKKEEETIIISFENGNGDLVDKIEIDLDP